MILVVMALIIFYLSGVVDPTIECSNQSAELKLGITAKAKLFVGQWCRFHINVIDDVLDGKSFFVTVSLEENEKYVFLYAKINGTPDFRVYDVKEESRSLKSDYSLVVPVKRKGRYYIGVWTSPCSEFNTEYCFPNTTIPASINGTYIRAKISAVTPNSIPVSTIITIGGICLTVLVAIFASLLILFYKRLKIKDPVKLKYHDLNIGEMIGTSAYSTIHKGTRKGDSTLYIIKKFREDVEPLDHLKERFNNEVKCLKDLFSARIVTLYGVCEERFCLLFQEAEEKTLTTFINENRNTLTDYQLVSMAKSIAEGYEYIHNKGYFHGDIKPDNILVNNPRQVWISDFGHCHVQSSPAVFGLGDPNFLPPSHFSGKYGVHFELWSYALVMLYMVTGIPPRARNDADKLRFLQQIPQNCVLGPLISDCLRQRAKDFTQVVIALNRLEALLRHQEEQESEVDQDSTRTDSETVDSTEDDQTDIEKGNGDAIQLQRVFVEPGYPKTTSENAK